MYICCEIFAANALRRPGLGKSFVNASGHSRRYRDHGGRGVAGEPAGVEIERKSR